MTPTPAPPLSILMYHQVGVFERPAAHRAAYCHIDRFKAQLRFFKRFGYHVLSLEQAHAGLFGGAVLPPKSVVLTFDDGYENFKEHAWPALQAHGYPATVFLVSGLLGKTARWLANDPKQPPLMSTKTVQELSREGVHFGSHAVSHQRLSTLSDEQIKAEIIDSKARLEDVLGKSVPDFCYPYGDYNTLARDTVQEAGYRTGLTCIRGAANTADNAFELPRKAISYGDNLIGVAWKLHFKHARKG